MKKSQDNSQEDSSYGEKNLSKWGKTSRKYSRITPQVKDKLIFLIVRNNMSIKQAAQYLKINYSSAKFIFSQYRDKNQQFDAPERGQGCEYITRKLQPDEDDGVQLKYTVGGKYEGQTNSILTAEQIYQMKANNAVSQQN